MVVLLVAAASLACGDHGRTSGTAGTTAEMTTGTSFDPTAATTTGTTSTTSVTQGTTSSGGLDASTDASTDTSAGATGAESDTGGDVTTGSGGEDAFPVTNSYWITLEGNHPPTGLGTWTEVALAPGETACNIGESAVYLTSLVHTQDDDHRWQLRIGNGSQIYSIRTKIAGELIGAQACAESHPGPWVDRVLQFVLVDSSKHSAPKKCFIHQAGTYEAPSLGLNTPFWSPLLGRRSEPDTATFRTLVWPQQAHVYQDIAWQSQVLAQQIVRDVGDGIIEVTYVITNFGAYTFDHTNMPWSGFTRQSIPHYVLSTPNGGRSWYEPGTPWDQNMIPYNDTNGWVAMVQEKSQSAWGLGVVFGRPAGQNDATAVLRFGSAEPEDLTVLAAIPNKGIAPGETFAMRYYLVLGRLSAEIHPKANVAANYVAMETLSFDLLTAGSIEPCSQGPGLADCHLFRTLDRPVADAAPLFVLRDLNDQHLLVSSDPYALDLKPFLGTTTGYVAFLGWGVKGEAPPHPGMIRLSSVLPDPKTYPDPAKGSDVWVVSNSR